MKKIAERGTEEIEEELLDRDLTVDAPSNET